MLLAPYCGRILKLMSSLGPANHESRGLPFVFPKLVLKSSLWSLPGSQVWANFLHAFTSCVPKLLLADAA